MTGNRLENTPASTRLCQLGLFGRTRTKSVLLWWSHVFAFASVKEGNVIKVRGRNKCPCGCFCSRSSPLVLLRVSVKDINSNSGTKQICRQNKTPGIKVCTRRQTLLPVLLNATERPLIVNLVLEESRCRRSLCSKSEGCHLPVLKTATGGAGSAVLHSFG